MKKHAVICIALIAIFLLLPIAVNAATFIRQTNSFGGKITLTTLPLVTCSGSGTGPVVLISNLASAAVAVYSSVPGSNQTVVSHVAGVASGIYGAIPYYAKSNSTTPKAGDWILGKSDIVPDFNTCKIQIANYKIPFPVKNTSNYKTSGNTNSSFGF